MSERAQSGGLWKALGPGLLFAGAAIGVSHLVQSTRAGAVYGLSLIVFVLIANIAKYPAFRIGNQYAPATGENLLVAYRRQGRGALWLFIIATLLTMFAGCAAISITTAALAKAVFGLPQSPLQITLGVWALIALILYFGQYRALDYLIKGLLSFLTISTLISTALVLPSVSFSGFGDFWPQSFDRTTVLFIAALVGWMPAPLDTAAWQSLWSQAKARAANHQVTMREARIDFDIGFVATTFLAICFVLMGAGVMFESGLSFEASAAGFAQQIIGLYETTLGPGVAHLVGFSAFAVIFSTTLTAIDAWPRTLAAAGLIILGRSQEEQNKKIARAARHPYYWISTAVLLAGAWAILGVMMNSFQTLIDVATTVSFFTAPAFAFLNHRAMFGGHVPAANRLGDGFKVWSAGGVAVLSAFALFYLWIRFIA